MHPACPNKKQNHLQNSFLRRAQFWVRKTFSKPASLKRASLVHPGKCRCKSLADQISDLSPPTQSTLGRLLGRIEEGKGEAYATKIDVRCSDRNRVIAEKCILIATEGSATSEIAMKYSSFSLWLSRAWLAFMDESQQYGNYHEIAALAAIQQPALIVFVGDHRQTPGGLSKGRAAAANRQKLLHRPLDCEP